MRVRESLLNSNYNFNFTQRKIHNGKLMFDELFETGQVPIQCFIEYI